jgi:hypothetical protein
MPTTRILGVNVWMFALVKRGEVPATNTRVRLFVGMICTLVLDLLLSRARVVEVDPEAAAGPFRFRCNTRFRLKKTEGRKYICTSLRLIGMHSG